ncbi:Ubiquitin-protein ligase E3C [Orchesella cincta]|uniref:HECT-type E3 ubiquitin transferase n=1 Tax=Orchesella cincta TaxID=48709 RepID=A0A1D2MZI1_ORCCI|nr:Ubiquitin-protein ligase E3C [Orchesella cincta]
MSKFLFEGDFKRKPIQNLGGMSRHAETREITLMKANSERQKREQERARAAAILVLQAGFRGMKVRRALSSALREKFIRDSASVYTIETLELQMTRFNYFFKPHRDIVLLSEFGQAMLSFQNDLISNMLQDNCALLRLRLIIEKGFMVFSEPMPTGRTIVLRLLETFTDWNKIDDVRKTLRTKSPGTTDKVMAIIWSHLVLHKNFFERYKEFLRKKLEVSDADSARKSLQHYDYTIFYQRFLEVIRRLSATSRKFEIGKEVYVTKELVQNLLIELAKSLSNKFWVHQSAVSRGNAVVEYVICPCVAKELALEQEVFSESVIDDEDEYLDDMEDYDMKPLEEIELAKDFFADRQKIYDELKIIFKKTKLNKELSEFTVEMWNILYPVVSCLIGINLHRAMLEFEFLKRMTFERAFVRSMFRHVLGKSNRTIDELVVLGWLMTNLMKYLYDGEFLHRNPLNKEELLNFIRIIEDTYVDIILSDKDVVDPTVNNAKKIIAQTLVNIHDRNKRIHLYSEDLFLSTKFSVVFPMETHGIKFVHFNKKQRPDPNLSLLDQRLLRVLTDFPFSLSFHDRVSIWHQMIRSDQIERQIVDSPLGRQHVQIRRAYIYEDAFEKLSPENVPDLRADVRISLVNVVGVQEAGVDGGGLLREFLTEATKAGVDPNRGLFRVDSQNRLYPNPVAKKIFPDYRKHFFLMGRLVGKALYRQILLELPLAAFFLQLCAFGSVSSAVDYLATLDADLHKNLLKLRNFDGDWSELGLDFTIASDELGETHLVELKENGRDVVVDESNVIEYIHLVADYKINREIQDECHFFRCGLRDVVPILRIFSWKEMQTLISGSDKPIDVQDWKANTNYGGGYGPTHKTIESFWEVVEHFDEAHLRKLLKFVTSCSRPPLLGFKDLIPKFGISNAGVTDRLPTAATCMNLLKLPEFSDIETLRERLVYAISAQAGFELS